MTALFASYLAEHASTGAVAFRRAHTRPVLVRQDDEADEAGLEFNTHYMHRSEFARTVTAAPRVQVPAAAKPLSHGLGEVFAIEKRAGGAFPERIGIGRAPNADVRIPLPRISKYHAYFSVGGDGTSLLLTDAGSTNGTSVEARPLQPKQPVQLESGDLIHLGPYRFVYLTADGLARWVAQRIPR